MASLLVPRKVLSLTLAAILGFRILVFSEDLVLTVILVVMNTVIYSFFYIFELVEFMLSDTINIAT